MISYMSPATIPIAFMRAEARDLGISDRDLAKLTAQGDLDRIARGIYARAGHGADPDLGYHPRCASQVLTSRRVLSHTNRQRGLSPH